MPVVYLEPSDLSLVQAQTVLGFLNRASAAEQLARDIEFPDEPDIGVRLGQRLLDARAALGGQFTDIHQVRSVRLIGPERFTEICVAALGLDPRRWVDLFFGGGPMTLRAEEGLVLSLDVKPQPAWLGQPLMLFATVRSKAGEPRAGVAVTLQTNVGRLSYAFGFAVSEGSSITAITGADGRAEVRLYTPPDEPLSPEQRAALLDALGRLDANAPHPLALEANFLALVDEYALDLSYSLRRAMDLYTRQYRPQTVDSLSPGRWRLAWPMLTGVVRADAHPPEGGGTSLTHAVVTVSWKNWVGPWIEFLKDALTRQADFAKAFERIEGPDAVNTVVSTAAGFLASQPGLAREWLGKRVVDNGVRDFITTHTERMAPEEQAENIAQLEFGAREMRPGGLGTYRVVSQTRGRLDGRIDGLVLVNDSRFAEITRIEAEINQRAIEVDRTALAVEATRRQVDDRSTTLDQRLTRFDGQLTQFNTDFDTFQRGRTGIDTRLNGLQTDLANVRLDISRLPREVAPREVVPVKVAVKAPAKVVAKKASAGAPKTTPKAAPKDTPKLAATKATAKTPAKPKKKG